MGNYSDPLFLARLALEKPVENQHRTVKSYRDLSQEEIDLINDIKRTEQIVLRLVLAVQAQVRDTINENPKLAEQAEPLRWLAIAKTDIEKGFMALVRAVAMPVNKE